MEKIMKKTQRGLAFLLAVVLLTSGFCLWPDVKVSAAAPGNWGYGSSNYWANTQWGTDWKTWKQTQAPKGSYMRSYGCFVVSQAKLLAEADMVSQGFNPSVFVKWEHTNKTRYINNNFNQEKVPNAPVAYAQGQGGFLSKKYSSSSLSEKELLKMLNDGYYIIVKTLNNTVKDKNGTSHKVTHFSYISRAESIKAGKILYRDSGWGKTTIAFNHTVKLYDNSITFKVHAYYAYKVTKAKPVDEQNNTQTAVEPSVNVILPAGEAEDVISDDKVDEWCEIPIDDFVDEPTVSELLVNNQTYKITNVASGKALGVYTKSTTANPKHNQNMAMGNYSKTDPAFRWTLVSDGEAFIIHSATKNVVLNAYAYEPKSGTKVNVYNFIDDEYVDTQKWIFEIVGNNQYIIKLKSNPELVLTADSKDNNSGCCVKKYDSKNSLQKWTLEEI